MSLIQISNLSFCYEGSFSPVFEDLSLQLDTNWKLGFTGRNGRGKTTLLKLLSGAYPYTGSISADVLFSYFPYPVEDLSKTAREIAELHAPGLEDWRLLRELSLLQVPEEALSRPFSTLSNGERTKILLALLFLREDVFPLIDEPTNHLDVQGRELVSRYLSGKKGFLLVSHDRAFLDRSIDHILVLNRTGAEVQRGGFSSWWENKERQDAFEQAENEKLRKEIKELREAARRTSGWSDQVEKTKYASRNSGLRPDRGYIGHKSAKMMKRAKALESRREAAVEETAKLLKNVETAEDLKLSPLAYRSKRLLELRDLTISYSGRVVCGPLAFSVEQGDRVSLQGKNGCGKSSILNLISGTPLAHTGLLSLGSGIVLSHVPQDPSFLRGSLSSFAREREVDESLLLAILRKLDFSRAHFELPMESYSSGQKKKVLIAGSLCQKAHLYLWDEPLNFIDVFSRMQIEALLLRYRPTLLFVEHDKTFTDRIATKQIVFS